MLELTPGGDLNFSDSILEISNKKYNRPDSKPISSTARDTTTSDTQMTI